MVAEKDVTLATEVGNLLRNAFEGCVVYTAHEGSDALSKMRNVVPSLLVMGLELGTHTSGVDIFRAMGQEKLFASVPILVLSDLPDNAPTFINDLASGRMKFLSMPLESEDFLNTVRNLLKAAS